MATIWDDMPEAETAAAIAEDARRVLRAALGPLDILIHTHFRSV